MVGNSSNSNNIDGNFTGTLIQGNTKGKVSTNVQVNASDLSSEENHLNLQEIVSSLRKAIEQESDTAFSKPYREEALEQIKSLEQVCQSPKDEQEKTLARRAILVLQGIGKALPATATLVEACNKLLPILSKAFGLS